MGYDLRRQKNNKIVDYGLQRIGVFDDTVVGTTVGTQSLTGCRYIERDEIVALEDLDGFDSCFLWYLTNA